MPGSGRRANKLPTITVDPRIEQVAEFVTNPNGFAYWAYPWGEGELEGSTGPRKWQEEILTSIRDHLSSPDTRFKPYRAAIASGHGIGKSALLAFLIEWGMATCSDCKVLVTAGTGTQLDTKTVPEVTKWFNLSLLRDWFDCKATSLTIKVPNHERTWRTDFITWSDNNAQTFAGAHNQGKMILIVFDEASTISDGIWEVTDGALTDENTFIIWIACSQPTINTGRFRECFGSLKHRWKTFQIDSRDVEGTNKELFQQWIEDYGEDCDFVRVRVKGEFPRSGDNQFIPHDTVEAARHYKAVGYGSMPRIGALDVAKFGMNKTVLGERQGRKFRIWKHWMGLDEMEVAQRAIEYLEQEKPDILVVDADGIGGAVVTILEHRGYGKQVFSFHGGQAAHKSTVYYNRRAECWGEAKDWLRDGAEIPDNPELAADLCGPVYFLAKGKVHNGSIVLESKEDMKKKGLSSPDFGDTLAMTFGVTVRAKPKQAYTPNAKASCWS